MIYRFGCFQLDEERRELRADGRELTLQPRVFDLLVYFIRNRDRVVGKEELLNALWPGVIVTDASLQRAVSLARSALREGDARDAIRTYSREGYRFCLDVIERDSPVAPERDAAPPEAAGTLLDAARGAHEQCEWQLAVARFREADREGGLGAQDLERWAQAAQSAGQLSNSIAPLERAVAAHGVRGDRRGAARAALALAQVHFERREAAVARGWHRRAASFLATEQESPEHGRLEWLASRFAVVDGDLDRALEHADRARALGERLADSDLQALGLLYRGLALLTRGEIEEGAACLDEAAAAVLAGEVGRLAGGLIYCGVIWGCRNRCDWDRAAQWTENFTRWCERNGFAAFPGTCRLHRAEVLSFQGQLGEAEREVTEACSELSTGAPWAEGDAFRVLGDLCLTRGDLEGAETAFRRAHELGWDPQPGYAWLQLARQKPEAALRSLERSVDASGWSNRQRRGLLLAHLAIVAARTGSVERAREALAELDEHPERWSTSALRALVTSARGELALSEGQTGGAIALLRQALEIWKDVDSPLNAASTRLRLADCLAAVGDADAAELEASAAEAIFRKVGVTMPLRTSGESRRSRESRSARRPRSAPGSRSARESRSG